MKVILTWDYELSFGNGMGGVDDCLIVPTENLLHLARVHSVKMVFFVDAGYLFKLNSESSRSEILEKDFEKVESQLRRLVSEGHEVQLHVHPHWEDSNWNGTSWDINTSRYSLYDFEQSQISEIVSKYLCILKACSGFRAITAFRAGGWMFQPFGKIGTALHNNGLVIDSSVYPEGRRNSTVHHFDFRGAPEMSSWRFDDNPLKPLNNGRFLEVPISSFRTSPFFYWRLAAAKILGGAQHLPYGKGSVIGPDFGEIVTKLLKSSVTPVSMDGYKSTLLCPSFTQYLERKWDIFVPMGHPKAATPFSLGCLDRFMTQIGSQVKFIGFSELL
jgi:hypothetical protein